MFPDNWSYYKSRAIKRDSGAIQNWQSRLIIAESSPLVYRYFKISVTANNGGYRCN